MAPIFSTRVLRLTKGRGPSLGRLAAWCLGAVLLCAGREAPAQTSITLPAGAIPADPAIRRKGELMLLINQAKEELLLNHPEAAKEKCAQALQLDPENPDARFILAQVERQLKGEPAGKRSPVSSLPDAAHLPDAVARARVTTAAAVVTNEQVTTPAAGGMRPIRSAVPSEKERYEAPKPVPFWLAPSFLRAASIGLLGGIVALGLAMLYNRLSAGRRQRKGQAKLFERMQTSPAVPEGQSQLEVPAIDDDFPIGGSRPSGEGAAKSTVVLPTARASTSAPPGPAAVTPPPPPAPAASSKPDDTAVNFWADDDRKGRALAAGSAPASVGSEPFPSSHTPEAGGASKRPQPEEAEVIPAGEIFGEEFMTPVAETPPAPAARPDKSVRATENVDSRFAGSAPVAATALPKPVSPRASEPAGEGPIALDGLEVQASILEGFEEGADEESKGAEDGDLRSALGALDDADSAPRLKPAEIEEIPFSLEGPYDQTQAGTGADDEPEGTVTLPARPAAAEAAPAEEAAAIRLDGDFPLGGTGLSRVPTTMADSPAASSGSGAAWPAGFGEPPSGSMPDPHEEILLTGGGAQPSEEAESTLVDDQARQKAAFQDQLARGLAALDKADWKEAVKYLSIAHALDPSSDYAREKLRQANEKRSR